MFSRVGRSLRKGHQALRSRGLETAVDRFQEAVEAVPGDPRAYLQLALAQAAGGEYEAARVTAEAMLERFPDNAVALLAAARCRLEAGDPAGAETSLRAAAQRQFDNMLVQQHLALCALMNDRIAPAATLLAHVGHIANTQFLALFDREIEREEEPVERADELEAAADRFKPSALAANAGYLALFSYEVERRIAPALPVPNNETSSPSEAFVQKVARLQKRAARRSPVSAGGRWARARIARRLERVGERAFERKQFAEALAAFDAAEGVADNRAFALLAAGLAALRLEMPNRAARRLAKAYSRRPDDGLIASGYADALFRTGRCAEALAVFGQIEPAGPEDFHAHYGRGACLTALGRKRQALAQFRIAFEHYRLDSLDDCLAHSWTELLRRQAALARNAERAGRAAPPAQSADS